MSTQYLSPDDDWEDPFDIDTTVAHPARRYNYFLGGKDNFEADRISGDDAIANFPTIKIAAIENRRFLRRAVGFLVKDAGIRQFLDIGTGIPSAENVHEVAQAIAPDARVGYVDNDPIVLAHARRLLTGAQAGTTAYIHADLRDPAAILDNLDLRRAIDLRLPVALMLLSVAHFVVDGDDPYGHVAKLTDALAPGSYLAMSHATLDFMSTAGHEAVDDWHERERNRSRDQFRPRTKAEFARFFEGMELIAPGIAPIPEWRNDSPPQDRPSAADAMAYAAVARVP
jgi:S-adenosyl methyltransferase